MGRPSIDALSSVLLAVTIGLIGAQPAFSKTSSECPIPRADLSRHRIGEAVVPPHDRVRLTVDGIAADGAVGPDLSRLVYRLKGARRLDPRHADVALHTHDNAISVSEDFVLDAARATLGLRPDRRMHFIGLMQQLQHATLVLSLATPGYAQVYSFSQMLSFKATRTIDPPPICG